CFFVQLIFLFTFYLIFLCYFTHFEWLIYACDLTLDPNTANNYIILSDENRRATYVKEPQPYPDHPERFVGGERVLCGESLTGRSYWEVEWSGWGHAAVAYKEIGRKGGSDCRFGYNDKSWSLDFSDNRFTVWHNNKRTDLSAPSPLSNRVGVYLDWPAGTLSFYSVSDTHTHSHTYTHTTPHSLNPSMLDSGFMSPH
uniref:B30.2/SPRY domain-containing protein n=1 Tax=Sinocyclocheilus anshuiensis TaxID=1608454 RepID=A0A671MID6_9TELE